MPDALRIESLSKTFSDFKLQNISFSVPEGSVMGFIGPNGSGKTTTIKLILNLLRKQAGKVTVLGMDHLMEEQRYKEQIGVVFDSHFFVDEWNMQDVEKAMRLFYKEWNSSVFFRQLEQFQISKTRCVKDLSKGMQMKLMLACAFSHNARLLILDEPTSGLDPVSRDELLDILANYTKDRKHSVLFSTHITPDLNKIADRITFINKGKLLFTGNKDELTEKYLIISANLQHLTPGLESSSLGIKRNSNRFEALVPRNRMHLFSGYPARPASIDDIIVFVNKGGV